MDKKFDTFTEQGKQEVLNFAQISNCENIDTAIHYMEMSNFDLNRALSLYLENEPQQPQPPQQQQQKPQQYDNQFEDEIDQFGGDQFQEPQLAQMYSDELYMNKLKGGVNNQQQQNQQQKYEQERYLKKNQEEAYLLAQQEVEIKRQQEMEKERMQEEIEYEKKIMQQIQEMERKEKLARIQQEPDSKEGVITFAFRIPNGSKIMRRFKLTEKISLIFDFIETTDLIKFEANPIKFDLVSPFLHINLIDKQQQTIKDVFGESDQEQLQIKEF